MYQYTNIFQIIFGVFIKNIVLQGILCTFKPLKVICNLMGECQKLCKLKWKMGYFVIFQHFYVVVPVCQHLIDCKHSPWIKISFIPKMNIWGRRNFYIRIWYSIILNIISLIISGNLNGSVDIWMNDKVVNTFG